MDKYKRRRTMILLPLIIIFLLIIILNRGPRASDYESSYPKKIEYLNKVDTQAYLILNEIVYRASDDGVVDYELQEGQRVAKDTKVASLNLTKDNDGFKEDLLRVQSAIEYKRQSDQIKDETYEINDQDVNLISTIQRSLNTQAMAQTLDAIEALELNTKKNIDISEISDLINLSNQELEDRKEDLSRQISISNEVYRATEAGLISFKADGLEDSFQEEKIPFMDVDYLEANSDQVFREDINIVEKGQPIYKLVDNFNYHMAVPVLDESMASQLQIGEKLEVLVDNKVTISGEIVHLNEDEKGTVAILFCQDKLIEIGLNRIHQVSLIKDKVKTYLVNSEALVEESGQTGVYVKGLNGLVGFVPVKVFLQRQADTLVLTGDSKGQIEDASGRKVKTLTIYDEVISNPVDLEKGQVI